MKSIILLLLITMAGMIPGMSQQTGEIVYKESGIAFSVPEGWIGQENNGIFMMGSNTVPGLILIIPHNHQSVSELKAEALNGIFDQNGTQLTASGSVQQIEDNSVGVEFAGQMEWTPAKAYAIGMVNPYGQGITILATTSADKYDESYKVLALSVRKSVRFFKPETAPLSNQWKTYLADVKLTYMDSYYSSGGGSSGGYSFQTFIDLCSKGYFNYSSGSDISVGGGNNGAYSSSGSQGQGTWSIRSEGGNTAVLVLNFHDGTRKEYTLEDRAGKLYLNGERFYRTTKADNDYAPDCN